MPGLKIIEIEGIGPVYADKLRKVGIETTDELLLMDAKRVAKATGISYDLLEAWQDMADLIRISGIGPEYAEALNKMGVDSCKELATRNPESTLSKLNEAQATGIIRRLPTVKDIEDWINQAKSIEPIE
jgi:predicted flap endonuclease-1-like 5' DNA nuclease